MDMKQEKQTDEMEEAYKQLDGEPAGDAVSKAAKGEQPQTDQEHEEEFDDEQVARFQGKTCQDIEDAYAQLFEALAFIAKKH